MTEVDQLEFTITNEIDQIRSGKLSIVNNKIEKKSILTPTCLLYTKEGNPINLTKDLLEGLSNNKPLGLHLSFSDIYQFSNVLEKFGKGSHKFLSLENQVLFCMIRDANGFAETLETSDQHMMVNTRKGKTKVTVEEYQKISNQYIQPDVLSQFSVDIAWNVSRKKAIKLVTQNSSWLKSQIKLTPSQYHSKLFAVIQGSKYKDQRMLSLKEAVAHQQSIGGFILGSFGSGESPKEREDLLSELLPQLPKTKPRLITGIGSPEEVLSLVELGIDIFSNNYPNLMTEWGNALTFKFKFNSNNNNNNNNTQNEVESIINKINLWDSKYVIDKSPLVSDCKCFTCTQHTKAYIHHLLNTHEMLAEVLLTIHNTYHYLSFFEEIRNAIISNQFKSYKDTFLTQRLKE
ncbi:hypothetical protein DLAC_01227 [Tieghemostelium lacteum]|uniref:Queuine tRNA-ribosyltransferase accessory subunit 2 n=1 Tax=Tieghemostelium lacteum TaxID=361077 RepID=A0A152A853_TIELA|nr:hypothetical protein DLAC_01227 [Tieghemostelium lacteum]|eukprot:KYR02388.1 hypothetical protein DLAC_01227 [Tieghemostelium lacteum]